MKNSKIYRRVENDVEYGSKYVTVWREGSRIIGLILESKGTIKDATVAVSSA